MARNSTRELMMISLDKAIDLYLSAQLTEVKSPRYVDFLKTRLHYFSNFMKEIQDGSFKIQDLEVEDGRDFIRYLMNRDKKYEDHPMMKPRKEKLSIQYIHGCGRAIRSFSTWAFEEGYLKENVMRRLKLPKLPKTFPEPLSEEEIERVLSASLDSTKFRLRNFSIMMLFLGCWRAKRSAGWPADRRWRSRSPAGPVARSLPGR